MAAAVVTTTTAVAGLVWHMHIENLIGAAPSSAWSKGTPSSDGRMADRFVRCTSHACDRLPPTDNDDPSSAVVFSSVLHSDNSASFLQRSVVAFERVEGGGVDELVVDSGSAQGEHVLLGFGGAFTDAAADAFARILANTGWLLGGKGVGAVLSLAYLAIVTRTLGVADFGRFALVLSAANVIKALVSFDSWQIVVRYGQPHLTAGNGDALNRVLRFCILIDLASALAGAADLEAASLTHTDDGARFLLRWRGGGLPATVLYCCTASYSNLFQIDNPNWAIHT